MKKINVVGTSGSGKSTFSRQLAQKLNLPCTEMDALFWQPDWGEASDEQLFCALRQVVAQPGWVLDGNYTRTMPIKWAAADTVVWLDYSFARTLKQALGRALQRSWSGQELWPGTGNRETFRKSFLSRDSVLLWTVKTYRANRRKYQKLFADPAYSHIRFIRLASPTEAQRFIERLPEPRL